jgi:hypothetical protein
VDLLKPRREPSFGRFDAIILGLYALLAGCITWYHEPWADEAQAWLIARDSGFIDLFAKRLHYEGTPGLWHLWLWIMCRLHVSFTGMHWITVLTSIAAMYLLLRYSPLPPLVRALLPFCFSFVFLTAIIARNYSLAPLLTFAACGVLTGKKERPILFALFLGLLANTSSLAFLLALGLLPLYVVFRDGHVFQQRRDLVFAGTLVVVLMAFAAYTALPAPDMTYGIGKRLGSNPMLGHLLSEVTRIPQSAMKQDVSAVSVKSPLEQNVFLAKHASHPFLSKTVVRIVSFASIAFFAVSSSNILAIVFYGALLWWLSLHRSLAALLPLALVIVCGRFLGVGEHHLSLVTTAIVVALWLGWANHNPVSPRSDLIFQIVLLAVLLEQALWTAHAAVFDIRGPFDGAKATARFLSPEAGKELMVNIDYDSLAVVPYLPRNSFQNQSTSYWPWERGKDFNEALPELLQTHPASVLSSNSFTKDSIMQDQIIEQIPHNMAYTSHYEDALILSHGYHETHRFCGYQPAHFGFERETCDIIYEPVNKPE